MKSFFENLIYLLFLKCLQDNHNHEEVPLLSHK